MADLDRLDRPIGRPRPPRVKITYQDSAGARERELPFVVGVLADLGGDREEPRPLAERAFIDVDSDSFSAFLAATAPRLAFRVPNHVSGEGSLNVELNLRSLGDFRPGGIVLQLPTLRNLLAVRRYLGDLLAGRPPEDRPPPPSPFLDSALLDAPRLDPSRPGTGTPVLPAPPNALPAPLTAATAPDAHGDLPAPPPPREPAGPPAPRRGGAIPVEPSHPGSRPSPLLLEVERRLARVDDLLERQVAAVLGHPKVRRLEASWRGLEYLVRHLGDGLRRPDGGPALRIRVLALAREELRRDLERALEPDQSQLFKKVYEEEYGTFGGHPFGLLAADFRFSHAPRDLRMLEAISGVAAAAHAPFVADAAPELFSVERFAELERARSLAPLFDSPEMVRWRAFRRREDSRYVALTLPRVLLRLPYGPDTELTPGFPFREEPDAEDGPCLWGSAVWPLAERIARAFAEHGWAPALRGFEDGGRVRGLPSPPRPDEPLGPVFAGPTDIMISDRLEKELDELGFLALCRRKGEAGAAFYSARTLQEPQAHRTAEANANARVSTLLPYMLTASRFAHYLKVICRDKVGRFRTAEEASRALNRWVNGYVLGRDDAGPGLKAEYPLREARVEVTEMPGKPGAYRAVAFLRPHFQLDELTTALRMVVDLPPPAG